MSTRIKLSSCPVLTPAHLSSLHTAGIYSTSDLIAVDLNSLASRCTLSVTELGILKRSVIEAVDEPVTGSSLLKLLFSAAILKTGNSDLDRLLSGGLYTGEITEICGQSLSGKTRVCLQVAAETARAGKHVLFLDSCSGLTAHAHVVAKLLGSSRSNFDKDELGSDFDDDGVNYAHVQNELDRVRFVHVGDCFTLLKVLAKTEAGLKMSRQIEDHRDDGGGISSVTSHFQPSLIVIDSLASIMSPILGGKEVSQGLSYLASVGRELKVLSNYFNVAVIVTNHLVPLSQEGGGGDDDREVARDRPAMGLGWASLPHVRIKLAIIRNPKSDSSRRAMCEDREMEVKVHATLLKHSRLPCGRSKLFTL